MEDVYLIIWQEIIYNMDSVAQYSIERVSAASAVQLYNTNNNYDFFFIVSITGLVIDYGYLAIY